jgi:predicted metal-dependent peptidase
LEVLNVASIVPFRQPEKITPEEIKALKETYDKCKATLLTVSPFLTSLLRKARIIATTVIPTAAVNTFGEILINPKFFNHLDFGSQTFIVAHEVVHAALSHQKRSKNKNARLWNIASDAVTNKLIYAWLRGTKLEAFSVTMQTVSQILTRYGIQHNHDDLQKMSVEEIYKLLEKIPKQPGGDEGELCCPKCGSKNIRIKKLTYHNQNPDATTCKATAKCKCEDCGYEWEAEITVSVGTGGETGVSGIPIDEVEGIPPKPIDLRGDLGKVEGEVIQEGASEIYKDSDIEGAWKREFVRSYMSQKSIGRVPAELESVVEKMLESKVNWRSLLRQAFREGMGKTILATYRRPSRKHQDFPGIKRYTYQTVRALIDTSGSIGQKELEEFMGEIYEISKQCKVEVIMWDAKAYTPIEIENRSQVVSKLMKHIKGGGGTEIKNALVQCSKGMKRGDIVVILSDFCIFDWDRAEVQDLLNSIGAKAGVCVLVSTYRKPEPVPNGWRFVKLE